MLKEDQTFFTIREKSVEQWLSEMENHDDLAVRGGVKATRGYIDDLKSKIQFLEEKCSLKDEYLKKMKDRVR